MTAALPRKKRLTRTESQAVTRQKLLESAFEIVSKYGYEGASVDRISEEAGFSKGAFYSNFTSKEDILQQLLQSNASTDVTDLTELLGPMQDVEEILAALHRWSDLRSSGQKWGTIAIEFVRRAILESGPSSPQLKIFVEQWIGVGELLLSKLPIPEGQISALNLGGLVLEVTYGGISGFLQVNTSGAMIEDMLRLMIGPSARKPAAA
jgi:AcrR family transcriptional regulator